MRNKYYILVLLFAPIVLPAQNQLLPLEHSLNNRVLQSSIRLSRIVHTSVKPLEVIDVNDGLIRDSVIFRHIEWIPDSSSWILNKIYNEHLLSYSNESYSVFADFLPDLQIGYDFNNNRNSLLNSRGFAFGGSVENSFSFYSELFENQAIFPKYIDSYIRQNSIIPGQGFLKFYGSKGFDFAYSSASVSYRPTQYLGITAGHGKHFIGDGYRSMILSDNSFNYPFIKFTADIWKVKYFVMWTEFLNITSPKGTESFSTEKKNGVFHYLDAAVSQDFSIGLFEGLIWTVTENGFEWNYLNPIIFFRPVDFAIGSPANVVVGVNTSFKLFQNQLFYGQMLLDEMTIDEFIKNKGYWGNKYGLQFGFKSFYCFGYQNLFLQSEINLASPFTYSHSIPLKNYGHYNQSLAHPLGANFYEYVGIASYYFDRYDLRLQLNYARFGTDSSLVTNYGGDIYKSYNTRAKDYGNSIGQGISNTLMYADAKAAYILNPLTNLRFELSLTYRSLKTESITNNTIWFSFGIRSSFRNLYYDF
ncbi:MAG: hypothetical protein WDA22_01265 [Bacteroidota bacterium]